MDEDYIKDNFRSLNIYNFRNLAPLANSKTGNGRESLKINRSLKKDEIGGLVIVIGGNNCGKTNVLTAIEKSTNPDLINDDDYTNFSIVADVKPALVMNVGNNRFSKQSRGRNVSGTYYDYFIQVLFEKESFDIYKKKYKDKEYKDTDYILEMKDIIDHCDDKKGSYSIIETILSLRNDIDPSIINKMMESISSKNISHLKSIIIEADLKRTGTLIKNAPIVRDEGDSFKEVYGYNLSSGVYKFTPMKISDSDFKCKPNNLSPFLKNLLNNLECPPDFIQNHIYGKNSDFIRTKQEDRVNKELKRKVCNKFNKFFKMQEKQYSMRIRFESENVIFMLTCGDDTTLSISRQSEGFKWIFDFFFNSIINNKYKPGDIILIDEFGNGLNFGTIEELGNELRSFSKETGITFVLGTQNPMVIDTDYLDEVRLIVPHEDGSSTIVNDFNQFSDNTGENTHDVLRPILNGMTVSRNYMRTENRRTIFVEGVTDYFYLSSFSKKMREKNIDVDIDFLPINGVGCPSDNPDLLMRTLKSIERFCPTLFTDSDKAGSSMKESCKRNGIHHVQISDIFPGTDKKEIEDLFSSKDKEEYHVELKSFDRSACFAHNIDTFYDSLEDETINNFEKTIKYLSNAFIE